MVHPAHRPLFLEVVDHEEYVDLEVERDETGKIIKQTPINESRTAFVHLRVPSGKVIRAQIPHENLDEILALMGPDDFDPDSEWNRSSQHNPPFAVSPPTCGSAKPT